MKAILYGIGMIAGFALAGYELVQAAPWQAGFAFGLVVGVGFAVALSDAKTSIDVDLLDLEREREDDGAEVHSLPRRPGA